MQPAEYYNQLSELPMLPPEETLELFRKRDSYKQEWRRKKVEKKIFEGNLRLAAKVAHRYRRPPNVELDEIIAEANMGMLHAISKFEVEQGYRFSTYATPWIKQHIQLYLQRLATPFQMGSEMSIKNEHSKIQYKQARNFISMDETISETGDNTLASVIPAADSDFQQNLESDIEIVVKTAQKCCTAMELKIITSRWLESSEIKTFQEIAQDLNVSIEVARRLHNSAITKIARDLGTTPNLKHNYRGRPIS